MAANKSIFTFILLLICLTYVQATHFRFGSIDWAPTTQYNIVKVNLKLAFRYEYWSPRPLVGDTITSGTGSIKSGVSGAAAIAVPLLVNAINPTENWITGTASFTFTYPTNTNATYLIDYTGAARISTLENNKDTNWRLTSQVNINTKVINTSPVVNVYPIITVIIGQPNAVKIVATDAEQTTLSYSLSTPTEFGTSSGTIPPGISVNSSGYLNFNPPACTQPPCLWTTQVKVSDGLIYTVTDFILKAVSTPPATPPYFIANTPDDGAVIEISPKQTVSWSYVAKSDYSTSEVVISAANVPFGVTQGAQVGKNPGNITSSWTPTMDDIGSYVVSLSVTDITKGIQMTGQRSFVIVVLAPVCGHGNNVTCPVGKTGPCCSCETGWDPNQHCYECLPPFYGPKCLPVPDCFHGAISNGTNGDGSCLCYFGWTGPNCNITASVTCNKNDGSSVIGTTTGATGFISPQISNVYVSTFASSAFNVSFNLNVPNPLPALDIYILLDVAPYSNSMRNGYEGGITNFISSFSSIDNTRFGLGIFNDISGTGFNFQNLLSIGSQVKDTIKNDNTYTVVSNGGTLGNSFAALKEAASYSNGWANGAFRTIIVITDHDCGTISSADKDSLYNTLVTNSIMPVVLGIGNPTLTNWNDFINNKLKFGYTATTDSGNGWSTAGNTLVTKGFGYANTVVYEDDDLFVTSPIAGKSLSGVTSVAINIPVKYPTATPSTNPNIAFSVIGFGLASISVSYNHPPVASPVTVSIAEDSKVNFTLIASDPDWNILTAKFTTAISGSIKLASNGQTVSTGVDYPIATVFTYTPVLNFNGAVTPITYSVSDGCLNTTSTVSITVTPVNDPPTCQSLTTIISSTKVNSTFTVLATDVDDTVLTIKFSGIAALATYGQLLTNTGAAAADNTAYSSGVTFKFVQTNNVNSAASVSISYTVTDPSSSVSSSCSIPFSMTHSNVAPVVSAATPVTTNPGNTTTIVIKSTDSDSTTNTINFKTITTDGNGDFINCQTSAVLAQGTSLAAATLTGGSISASICYRSQASQPVGTNVSSIVVTSTDDAGAESAPFAITINIAGLRNNNPPTATPVGPFTLDQDTISQVILLNGSDIDPLDYNKLKVVFTQPSNGKLVLQDGVSATTSPSLAPYNVYYKPNYLYYGADSFTFYVFDTMSASSNIVTVSFTVRHVNHAPTLPTTTLTFTQLQTSQVTLQPNDIDNDTPLLCEVASLPGQGQLTQSNGQVISTVGTKFTNNIYSAKESPAGNITSYTTTFNAKCCDPSAACATTAMTINYVYINQPPVAVPTNVSTDQDTPVTFDFKFTDDKPAPVTIKLVSLPTNGKLITSTGVTITGTSLQFSPTNVVYVPNKGMSNEDTVGFLGPLDTISFNVIDGDNAISSVSSLATFYVAPRKPPVFTGKDTLTTLEDTSLEMFITGLPPRGQTQFTLTITNLTGEGMLNYYACNEADCLMMAKIGDTFMFDTAYKFTYVPPANRNGLALFTIFFTLTSEQSVVSDTYNITINVTPVNDPPVLQFTTYQIVGSSQVNPLTGSFSFQVNQSAIISWTGSDIDSPFSSLTATILAAPRRGSLYTYNATNVANGFIGTKITKTTDIGVAAANQQWTVVFVADPNAAGVGYGRFTIYLNDDFNLASQTGMVSIDVDTVNLPPKIHLNQTTFSGEATQDVEVTGISYHDQDYVTGNINNTLTLSVVDGDGKTQQNAKITVYGTVATRFCDTKSGVVQCTANEPILNSLISSVRVNINKDGDFYLRVYVNDLGYNAPVAKRNVSQLTDTKLVKLSIAEAPVKKTTNTTVLSAAIAGAAVGAALLAAGVWRLIRKVNPPTSAFFGEGAFADGAISSNPLYQESQNGGVNPFYEASGGN